MILIIHIKTSSSVHTGTGEEAFFHESENWLGYDLFFCCIAWFALCSFLVSALALILSVEVDL